MLPVALYTKRNVVDKHLHVNRFCLYLYGLSFSRPIKKDII